ncbi:MAG: biopolymer transporter ExbD [Lentisphaeria bacterium]|nr:biopolymer transporter ExbD [Lentisphaeria bacterium]
MRFDLGNDDRAEVQMSPLIDCVFLLLIFFLVTTMMKKWEMQIPLSVPSMSASVSATKKDAGSVILSVDAAGRVFQVLGHNAYSGENSYAPVPDPDGFLTELRQNAGTDVRIDVAAFRDVPVGTVIALFDQCQIHGFSRTRVRLGSKPHESADLP